ncbi:hypothetical protein O5542_25920 [Escherichia coli]|nr:hypothetical protein [Escherichia coli]MCZ5567809.1 hypothetical protein [Escherichia coli]MCZ5569222.1 hypothetical protein [Escherichia coli]
MCELDILHDSLYQFCPELHLKRLNSLCANSIFYTTLFTNSAPNYT